MNTNNILLIKYHDNDIKYYINDSNIELENIITNTISFIKFYINNSDMLIYITLLSNIINDNKPLLYIHNNENIDTILNNLNYKSFGTMNNIYFHPQNNKLLISYNIPLSYNTIFVFWTGNNKMSLNRINSLHVIIKCTQCNIVLITPDNLNDYIINNYPIHKTYLYLHYYHRADYLRCYFMHHYGGGYTDLKRVEQSWLKHFDTINNSKDIWIIGYKELPSGIINNPESINANSLQENYHKIVGNGAFICKNNTKFTSDWYAILNYRLTEYYDLVFHKFPISNHKEQYIYINNKKHKLDTIIHWTNLLGDIIQPLLLKYNKNINQDLSPPIFENYR